MEDPVLHRVQRGSRSLYWVGQYPVYLLPEIQGWHIYTPASCLLVRDWLKELGLAGQFFSSRAQAMDAICLALDDPKAPQPDPLPALKRTEDGNWLAYQRFQIRRRAGIWTIFDQQSQLVSMVHGSLWQTCWAASYIQHRAVWRQGSSGRLVPQLAPSARGGDASLERAHHKLVMEGTDRPSLANQMMGMARSLKLPDGTDLSSDRDSIFWEKRR